MINKNVHQNRRNAGLALIWVVVIAFGAITVLEVGKAIKKQKEQKQTKSTSPISRQPEEEKETPSLTPTSPQSTLQKVPRLIAESPCAKDLNSKECEDFVRQQCEANPYLSEGKSELVKKIKIVQQDGARPRFSPDGKLIVFDRKDEDGFYDVYVSDPEGKIVKSLTEGKNGIAQRNNGNAIFYPSGEYIVFISEEESHAFKSAKWAGDPGLGIFANLWAMTPDGDKFWQLTNIPIKKNILDKTFEYAMINPHFSHDGSRLVWTERYAKGGNNEWGEWRINMADFIIEEREPRLESERVVFTAEDVCQKCSYVTSMGFVDENTLLLSGNLDGQHEYGMDQYLFDFKTQELTNLQNSPEVWEEGAAISPDGNRIVYMSNVASRYKLDFDNPNWPIQPREREYWVMDVKGEGKERLTYFNDPLAPEYMGRRIIVAASDFSPDGRFLAGTLGVDFGNEKKASIELKIVLIEF